MSACILPLAPEFQDPPASQNFSPIITDSLPPLGSIVTKVGNVTPMFRVTISDPNLGDDLHVRWLADYPPASSNTRTIQEDLTIPHPVNGQPLHQDVSVPVDCALETLAPIAQHQVEVVVADRPFPLQPTGGDLTSVPLPGLSVVGSWTLILNCGSSP